MKEIEIETPCGIVKGIREDQINNPIWDCGTLGISEGSDILGRCLLCTAFWGGTCAEESVFTRGDQRKGIF